MLKVRRVAGVVSPPCPGPMPQGASYVCYDHEPGSYVRKNHNTRRYEHPLAGGPGPIGVGLWASWQVLVRVAKSAAPGVFGRERNSGPRAAVRTIQVDIQYVRGCHHWPEGVLNDKGLRVAEMAGEQLLLLYHLS